MKIPGLGVSGRQAAVILGAGATRGASCYADDGVAPPLDADFFEQIQKLAARNEEGTLCSLLEFAREEFGVGLDVSMEKFFTQIEGLDAFHRDLKIKRGKRVSRYEDVLREFRDTLATTFALLDEQRGRTKPALCTHHGVIASALERGDTVISFNYDCLMDMALRDKAGKAWNASLGYGRKVVSGAEYWHTHEGKGPPARDNSIMLLKMHGSLNWRRSGEDLHLRKSPYVASSVRAASEIVPPVWNKRIADDVVLTSVWKAARQALGERRVLVVIGYSVPDTDLLSQSLLRVATSEVKRGLSHLVVVNPDVRAQQKLITLLSRALGRGSAILRFGTLEEFVAVCDGTGSRSLGTTGNHSCRVSRTTGA